MLVREATPRPLEVSRTRAWLGAAVLDRRWLPWMLALLAAVLPYTWVLRLPLFSPDTWPSIVADQVHDLPSLEAVLFSPLMAGTEFATQAARYYHPLTSLTFSLDRAVFGLNAAGYHATNLALHVAAVLGLVGLARALGLSRWGAALAGVVFAVHPISMAAVPDIPRRQDLVVAVCLIAALNLVARSSLGSGRRRALLLVGGLACFGLALGAKEVAYAGIGAALIVPLAAQAGAGRRLERRWLLLAAVGCVAVEVAAFLVRWHILGGFGGGSDTEGLRGRFDSLPELFVVPFVRYLLWPLHAVLPTNLRGWLVLGVVAVAVGGLALRALPRRHGWIIGVGLVWPVPFLVLYIVVRNAIGAYGLYAPLGGLALLVAAVIEGAARTLPRHPLRRVGLHGSSAAASAAGFNPHPPTPSPDLRGRGSNVFHPPLPETGSGGLGGCGSTPERTRQHRAIARRVQGAALGVAAGAAGVFVGACLWASSAVQPYREWADAAAISDSYLGQLRACLDRAPTGGTVEFDGLPFNLDYGTDESRLIDARVLTDYSMASLLRVEGYADRFSAVVPPGKGFPITHPRVGIELSCQASPGKVVVASRAP